MSITRSEQQATRSVFHISAFRVLFVAEVVSVFGTQLARVALAVLVFQRTDSAAASALTYATSYLPAVLGGAVLGSLGDRFPKRVVMVALDVVRAVLFAGMALPGMSTPVIVAMLAIAVFLDPGFGSAQLSYLAEVLLPESFRTATGVRATADQITQVVGFGAGGALTVILTPQGALMFNAATFVVSALLLALLLERPSRRRSADAVVDVDRVPIDQDVTTPPAPAEFRGLWRDTRTRLHMIFMVLIALYVLPEALAVAYASDIGASTTQAGVLLAAIPLGSAIGCVVILRVPSGRRESLTNVLAVLCGLPLLVCVFEPSWALSWAAWFVCGLLSAYAVEVISALMSAIPARNRSRLTAQASAWLTGAQGAAFALAGVLADWLNTGTVIAGAGLLGAATALAIILDKDPQPGMTGSDAVPM